MSKKRYCVMFYDCNVSQYVCGRRVSVAAEQQKPAYSNLADAKSRKEVRSAAFCQRESLPKQRMPG